MRWLRNNWQLKLLAFTLALFLWLVLYLNPPATTPQPLSWPPPVRHFVHGR